jgi:AraC-like DNA-binding protein
VRAAPLWATDPHHARLVGLLADLLVALPVAPLQLPLPTDLPARHVARAILAEPAAERSIDELARAAGASRRTVERRFRHETGLSPVAWRQRARVLEALRLLAEGQAVTTVAASVGYSTPSAFTAVFRRHTGTTPSRHFEPEPAAGRFPRR